MSDSETKAKFYSLSEDTRKQINREANIIKECGANHFFIETGCQVDQAGWLLVAFAMLNLRLISSKDFYGA